MNVSHTFLQPRDSETTMYSHINAGSKQHNKSYIEATDLCMHLKHRDGYQTLNEKLYDG